MNNPFEAIQAQMTQAKNNYDQTMNGLQSQLQAIRQQATNMYQNPYGQNPYMQQMPQMQQQYAPQMQTQQQPENIAEKMYNQQMDVLNGIKEAIEKNNKLLNQFITGEEKSVKKSSKTKENESNQE